MDHRTFLSDMPTDTRTALCQRSTRAGLVHLSVHLSLILALGVLIAAKPPLWPMLMLPQGILIVFLFTLQHEATHKTPFASEPLNEAVGWFCGVLIVQPFLWFRYFHLMHHRYTNIAGKDPELAGLPKPDSWPALIYHLSTIGYWGDKISLLWQLGFSRITAPYLAERLHPRLRREARGMIVIYGLALVFSVAISPVLLWVWLVPILLGFPVLRLYLLAEHGRCPKVADMFLNTRTTFTNRIVRFLAWNMPYHTEHHVFPQVPFYLLPELHKQIRPHLGVTSPGYAAFTANYVAGFDAEPR